MGSNLAKSLNSKGIGINDYLNKINLNPNTLFLSSVTPAKIGKYIDKLPSKNINNLLKRIKYAIITPLTHIFNLSINNGKFPEKMKVADIIPLFKKGAKDLVINYRLISLLITMSKLLENEFTKTVQFLGQK